MVKSIAPDGSGGGMLAVGAGIHLGAFGVLSEFHARKVSNAVPTILPNPQVNAATIPTIKGASPMMMMSNDEGLISKLIVARRSLDRATSSPRMA